MTLNLAAFFVYYFVTLKPRGLLNANAIFVYIQMIMAVGSYTVLDQRNEADVVYGYVVLVSMLVYFATSSISLSLSRAGRTQAKPVHTHKPDVEMWALIVVSGVIIILYYRAVGYSALFRGISNSLSGGDADIAGDRLNSYSGTTYLFPGYVNQFKNVLLPSMVVLVITYWRRVGQFHPLAVSALVALSLFGLLGTGQRGAFIQFSATAIYFIYLINRRQIPVGVIRLAAVTLAFMVASTIALGRSNSTLPPNASLADRVYVATMEFGGRVFETQQYSAVAGFRYIYEQPIQWGHEWMQGILGVLPSSPGTDLPKRIYAILYGTDRGTAPPSVWGSIYHNLGWWGVVIAPALLAIAISALTKRSLSGVGRNTLETIGIAGTSISVGFWAAGGPETLLNTGLVAYLFLWWWGKKTRLSGPERDFVGNLESRTQNTSHAQLDPSPTSTSECLPSFPTAPGYKSIAHKRSQLRIPMRRRP